MGSNNRSGGREKEQIKEEEMGLILSLILFFFSYQPCNYPGLRYSPPLVINGKIQAAIRQITRAT
jgi:hypothetical protein